MPPFASTKCPNCKQSNRFDLAELKSNNTMVLKSLSIRSASSESEEFSVTCQHCGRKFKLIVKGEKDAKEE